MPNEPAARILWRLSQSAAAANASPNLTGPGNSDPNGWQGAANPSKATNLDLRYCANLGLYVYVGGITGSPSFKVSVDGYDPNGNLFPALAATATLTAAGPAAPVMFGLHGTPLLVLPEWGQVSWTLTGGTVTGTEITLIAR